LTIFVFTTLYNDLRLLIRKVAEILVYSISERLKAYRRSVGTASEA